MNNTAKIASMVAVLIGVVGIFTFINNQNSGESNKVVPSVTPTQIVTQTPAPTVEVPTATPTPTNTPTPTATPKPTTVSTVKKAVWLNNELLANNTKVAFSFSMPSNAKISNIASNRMSFTIGLSQGTMRFDSIGATSEPSKRFLSNKKLTGKIGTVYRVVDEDEKTVMYSTDLKTSGTCTTYEDNINAPCGTTLIVIKDFVQFTATCNSSLVTTCDEIMKSLVVTKY